MKKLIIQPEDNGIRFVLRGSRIVAAIHRVASGYEIFKEGACKTSKRTFGEARKLVRKL